MMMMMMIPSGALSAVPEEKRNKSRVHTHTKRRRIKPKNASV